VPPTSGAAAQRRRWSSPTTRSPRHSSRWCRDSSRSTPQRAPRAGLRARLAPGAVDLYGLRCLGPRSRRRRWWRGSTRLGRFPLGGRLRRRRLRAAAGVTWSIPKGDVAATANDRLYPVLQIAYGNCRAARPRRGRDHRRRDVALRARLDHLDGAHVVRVRARRRHARRALAQARASRTAHARVVDRRFTSALAVLITGYAAAYSVVTSISTITLYLAYVIPIWLKLAQTGAGARRVRERARRRHGASAASGRRSTPSPSSG